MPKVVFAFLVSLIFTDFGNRAKVETQKEKVKIRFRIVSARFPQVLYSASCES